MAESCEGINPFSTEDSISTNNLEQHLEELNVESERLEERINSRRAVKITNDVKITDVELKRKFSKTLKGVDDLMECYDRITTMLEIYKREKNEKLLNEILVTMKDNLVTFRTLKGELRNLEYISTLS